MDFVSILERFKHVSEEADGGYLALCPAHSDSRPSLRIWRGDDLKVRLTCRAGCDTGDVVKAAGLRWADLFDASGEGMVVPKERPQMVGTKHIARLRMWLEGLPQTGLNPAGAYACDRFGIEPDMAERLDLRHAEAVTFSSVEAYDAAVADGDQAAFVSRAFARYPRMVVPLKGFDGVIRGAQGRDLSGKCPGRWLSLSNPEGSRWAPFGVFRGESGYGVVLLTEGPGDALTAVSVGYDAVAIRGASLVNNPETLAELADGLRGYQVIVCGDNDPAGQGFTLTVSEGLAAHGIDAYTLTLPVSGDDLTSWRERDPAAFPSALHAAVKAARPVKDRTQVEAEHRKAEVAHRTGAVQVSSDQGAEAARILGELVTTYGEDADAMNAFALVAWTDGRIKYAPGLGYFVWDGVTWVKSATRVRQEIHAMGAALVLAGYTKEARGFTMTSKINNLLEELRSVPSVYVDAEEFDAKPFLLSFANGVVDLRTGKLRAHDKHDMLTVTLPIEYDPTAQAPRWEQFLSEVFPGNPDLVGYMRRLVGYGITGNTSEQCFAVLWGKGANGKSVFTETLTDVFGRITKTTPFATFEDKGSGGGIPNDLAALRGSRLVMASEGESGKPMSEAVLKRVTGKDKVTARFLRQEFFTFAPTFLILLATNHKPKFKSQDEGLWRRVKLIPFKRYFAPEERDYDLDRKLRAEAAGIVAWAVRGAVEWYANGLKDPASISAATREYRATSDALAGFFPGVLESADEATALPGADAYNAYRDWCEAEGLKSSEVWSRKAFYGAMEERNVTKRKTNKGIALVGVKVADAPAAATGPGIFAQG
ncbi:toprim domain-containing protein [Streptomyces sp. CB04723]|uniref:phage/plasmid primase, P4 family n=1 Tax=Streptomyces TaxID=1883 RepID=UPI0015C472F8|nr:phage/plasmid primase, P4 family [Streptomyces sp. CB04723]QLG33022.1 toprim domain-containing protein [Streptomyces sp. CB04723]